MQEPTFLILTALAGPPLHGYGIMQAVAELSRGSVTMRAGTLYAALDRLTAEGLIEVDHQDEWAAGRVRRFYRLTEEGGRVLGAEAQQRRDLAVTAARRLAALEARRRTGPTLSPASGTAANPA